MNRRVERDPPPASTADAKGPVVADAIVVAAGSSSRMGGLDKLDHPVAGRPLLAHALAAIAAAPEVRWIVVVTTPERVDRIRGADWLPSAVASVVAGGARRHESVAAGLVELDRLAATEPADAVSGGGFGGAEGHGDPDARSGDQPEPGDPRMAGDRDTVILVHDGARPLVDPGLVSLVARAAAHLGAAIPVVPLAETLKRLDGDRVAATVDREGLAIAQTPQGIRGSLLREAFRRFPPNGPETWTDEAALLEACRIPVHAIPGDPSNLKVTLPADLDRVERALAGAMPRPGSIRTHAPTARVGVGHDSHSFGPGSPLALGGLAIDGAPRLIGHSDGDVVLHAVADAILGAAGLGDLGRLFPAGPDTPRGIASAEMIGEVARRLAVAGLAVANLDVTIVAARPRLAGRLDELDRRIAELLGVDARLINVKASTGNLAGMEGAGRGISAQAVVNLVAIA